MSPEISPLALLSWGARRAHIASKGLPEDVVPWLIANGAPERVVKSPIGGGSTTDSALGPYGISLGAWSDTARNRSAFYRLLADGAFVRMPFYTPIGMVVATASGAAVAEGAATPIGKVKLATMQLLPQKAVALIVCTAEMLRNVSAAGQTLFSRELLGAVSDAVDGAFFSQLVDTASPAIGSSSPLVDVRAALSAVNSVGTPRLYWVSSVDVAKWGSTLATNAPAFAAVSPAGGELTNLPMLVSSGLASGTLALIDGSGIAADGLVPSVETSAETDIKMDSVPPMNAATPAATTMTSMFATNSVALKATAVFGCEKLHANAVAVVHNISATTWSTT